MNNKIAQATNGSYGTIDGVEITEEIITRLVRNAEEEFPDAVFRAPSQAAHTDITQR
ncbi:MAG: hypothetical protein QM705_00885 [Ancrocorticia sp.]